MTARFVHEAPTGVRLGRPRCGVAGCDLSAAGFRPAGAPLPVYSYGQSAGSRPGTSPSGGALPINDLRLDQDRRQVTLGGEEVRLTPTEYEMLKHLMANAGKVVTHRALLHAVWGTGYEDADAHLRVFIAQLRRKIERDPTRGRYIQTETGVGYRFRDTA